MGMVPPVTGFACQTLRDYGGEAGMKKDWAGVNRVIAAAIATLT
jgi:hypothetical protein